MDLRTVRLAIAAWGKGARLGAPRVGRVSNATAATGSCTPRKSQVTTIRLMRGMETRTTVLAWEEGASRVIDCSNLWVGGWKRTARGGG